MATKKKTAKRKVAKKKVNKKKNPKILDKLLKRKTAKGTTHAEIKVQDGSIIITGNEVPDTLSTISSLLAQGKDDLQVEFHPSRKGKKSYVISKDESLRDSEGGYSRLRGGRRR